MTRVYASNGWLKTAANGLLGWDEEEKEYKIEESPSKVKTFDEYVFVMRTRIDK